jgi:hypothetical protein
MGSGPREAVGLYRAILKVHRSKLPPPIREMGNRYVKEEFKAHFQADTTEQQWKIFLLEWTKYFGMLNDATNLQPEGSGQWPMVPMQVSSQHDQRSTKVESVTGILGTSGELSAEAIQNMSPEQRERLLRLRQEAVKYGKDVLRHKE